MVLPACLDRVSIVVVEEAGVLFRPKSGFSKKRVPPISILERIMAVFILDRFSVPSSG